LIYIGVVSAVVRRREVPVISFGLGIYEVWIPDRDGKKLGQSPGEEDDDVVRINVNEDDKKGHYEYFLIPVTIRHHALVQGPKPGSFEDCFQRSGLATTHVKDQYADGKLFTQEAANLLLDINNAEGTSLALLGVTLMNENTTFDLRLRPNTNGAKDREWWDVGPFQINQHYTNLAVGRKVVSMDGRDYGGIYGMKLAANEPFYGDPLQNGRMAARRLNTSGTNDRQRAINYAMRDGRGKSYDSFGPLFNDFFNCYKRQ
jgi:hypothetical protein